MELKGIDDFGVWPTMVRPGRSNDRLIGTLAAILRAVDIETIWALLGKEVRAHGFDGIIYGYSPNSYGPTLGAREDFLVLSTLERPVLAELVDKSFYRESVTFNWALSQAGVFSWSMKPEDAGMPCFTPRPEALEFFEKNGLTAGCTIGFATSRTRGRGAMALIAPRGTFQSSIDAMLGHLSQELFVLASVAHRVLVTLPYVAGRRSLTARQREVLEWVAEGKSVADIAHILGIAQPTVEKHLKLAREVLGVETTAHAVIKAAFLNQMFMVEPDGRIAAR